MLSSCARHFVFRILAALALLLAGQARGEQSYVGRFDAFGGYSYLSSRHIDLTERGFHIQTGVRARRWLTFGFDYSRFTGHTALVPSLMTTEIQDRLRALFAQLAAAGRLPAGYTLSVPIDSTTDTFAAGPQVAFRHWQAITLFVRPAFGAIHETAIPKPGDPIAQAVVNQLAPSGKAVDWVAFYGFGGGVDLNITPHFAIKVQGDFVRDHLFADLLKDSRNSVRFSIGPSFQFGKDVR